MTVFLVHLVKKRLMQFRMMLSLYLIFEAAVVCCAKLFTGCYTEIFSFIWDGQTPLKNRQDKKHSFKIVC